ncbi:probable calcium-binding protein CML22 [Punica granatum]|uniref:Uncharacterized protein n=2 Tax=Punica granatum TaxID=22663 RepID=A0A2I0JNR8_PUNGR|nr:probable calcium-binding protein CML22 [Punica granatum]PKI57573.1 hypothetical protein CRG98_022044 [Punica granatum]
MKGSSGEAVPCASLRSLSSKVGNILCCCGSNTNSPHKKKYKRLDSKLETKMAELKRRNTVRNFTSINSIILRFPQFREALKTIGTVFEQFDEDSNGTIDRQELRKCLEKLQLQMTDKDVDDLFHSCDMDGTEGIQFKEYIVLLCLIHLLKDPSPSASQGPRMGSLQLEATFDAIIEAFLFLDKNGDGKLNKKDLIKSLDDPSPWEKSPAYVAMSRFKEMDWDRNGNVSFREFLFALVDWVGLDIEDDIPIAET